MRSSGNRKIVVDREKFIESVCHVVFYGNTLKHFESVLYSIDKKVNKCERETIRYSIQWNVLIIAVSLLDELKKFFFAYRSKDSNLIARINSYKTIIEPVIIKLQKWPDLRKFRNNVLAHNFRIRSDNFSSVHVPNKLSAYKIPNQLIELATLFKYLISIANIANEMFTDEYNEGLEIIDASNTDKKKKPQPWQNEVEEANAVFLEMNTRIEKYNSQL